MKRSRQQCFRQDVFKHRRTSKAREVVKHPRLDEHIPRKEKSPCLFMDRRLDAVRDAFKSLSQFCLLGNLLSLVPEN